MKIHSRDARLQLAEVLKKMLDDWNDKKYINSLRSYCGGYEFPYSQLRKMEDMKYIRPFSSARKNKTYEWIGGNVPSFEGLAQRIMNNIARDDSKMYRTKYNDAPEEEAPKGSFGFMQRGKGNPLVSMGIGQEYQAKVAQAEKNEQDETSLAIKIAMILKENALPDDRVEPVTKSILSLLR